MPGKFLKIIVATLLCTNAAYSQAPSIEWQKCYGGAGGETPYCINSTSDGGSIVCGYTQSNGTGDVSATHDGTDMWVIKLDANGTLMWQQPLGGIGAEFGNSIEQTADGGYIVAGFTSSNNTGDVGSNQGDRDYWIVKLTSTGSISWQKTYGGTGTDIAHTIHQTSDGGYIVAGESDSPGGDIIGAHGANDVWILKLDGLGNIVWQRALGGTGADTGYDIKQTNDGGYMVAALSVSTDGDLATAGNMGTAWIIKLTAAGSIDWQKTYGNAFAAFIARKIYQTNDGYVILSSTWSPAGNATGNHGGTDYCVIKTDNLGNLIWQKSYGGSSLDEPYDIIPAADGGIIVVGWSVSGNGDITGSHGNSEYWVVKLSDTGNLLWQKAMGGDKVDQSYSICQATDGGYVVSGYTGSNNIGDVGPNHGTNTNDFWIVKLTPELLPITLSSFNAIPKKKDVFCSWKTLQEANSHHFIIERSEDASRFVPVGNVAAAGNSSLPLEYHFTDAGAMLMNADFLYYRLKMVDIDGSFKHSNTIKIKTNYAQDLSIYPNPVVDLLTATFTSDISGEATVSIIDHAGKKIYHENMVIKKGSNTINIRTGLFPAGSYILSVNGANKFIARFIKADQ